MFNANIVSLYLSVPIGDAGRRRGDDHTRSGEFVLKVLWKCIDIVMQEKDGDHIDINRDQMHTMERNLSTVFEIDAHMS